MNNRVRHLVPGLAATAVLVLAPVAAADSDAVLRDCVKDESLDGSYSEAEKRGALKNMPAEVADYTECEDVIRAAIGARKAGESANGASGGAGANSPEARRVAAIRAKKAQEAQAARRALARKERERKLGARAVDPRDAGVFGGASTVNGVPLPLLLVVIALALLSLAGGALVMWRRNPALADAVRRVIPQRFRR